MTPDPSSPRPRQDGAAIKTHAEAIRIFFSKTGPRRLAAIAGATWAARALLGPPGPRDVLAAASAIALWPVQEWVMHRYLLHLEPRTIAGIEIDPGFARAHRRHHRDPRDVDRTLLPLDVITFAGPIAAGAWLIAFGPSRAALTGMAAYSTMALFYEWTHFIVHTGVTPRTAYGRKVRTNHRLHHYRNEAYWLGFTMPLVDRVLGTDPEPARVPRSKTAMDLFGLAAAEAAPQSARADASTSASIGATAAPSPAG